MWGAEGWGGLTAGLCMPSPSPGPEVTLSEPPAAPSPAHAHSGRAAVLCANPEAHGTAL